MPCILPHTRSDSGRISCGGFRAIGLRGFYWQPGYGAFSVSESNAAAVREYIRNQEEHYKKMSFKDELLALLRRHDVEYDEEH